MGTVLSAYETLTKRFPVSVEEILEIQRRRASFRNGRMFRRRAAKRRKTLNPRKRTNQVRAVRYSGEGELHDLLRQSGLKVAQFCALAGIHSNTFTKWQGHPIAKWPVELLRYYLRAQKMEAFLKSRGWDPREWHEKPLPPAPQGRYARTSGQGAAVIASIEPENLVCPVHGPQRALGGECPKC